jgi:head-tail adaptor
MNPGQFNREVLLQRLTTVSDGAGGTTRTEWVDVQYIMASVEPAAANRRLNYNQIITEGWSHVLTTWYMAGLEPNVRMRAVLEDGTIMLIHSVINNSYHNRQMELACYADPMDAKYDFPVEDGFGLVDDFDDIAVIDDDYVEVIADLTDYAVDENGNAIFNEIGEQVIL